MKENVQNSEDLKRKKSIIISLLKVNIINVFSIFL